MTMADRLDSNSEAWRPADYPEHPNPLMGRVVEVDTGDGDYGVFPIVHVVDANDKEWRIHGFGQVLAGALAKKQPAIGDTLGIKFLGEEDSKNFKGKKYKNWRVIVEKAEGSAAPAGPDWAALSAAAEKAEEAENGEDV